MSGRVEVPQATLERTREVVDAIAGGAGDRQQISAASGIALRQVGYGVAAARALGLFDGSEEQLSLSARGRELAATEPGTEDEARVLREAIQASTALAQIAPELLSAAPPSHQELAAHIQQLAALSDNTAAHRAGMLLSWRKRLTSQLDPRDLKQRQIGARWRRIDIEGFRSLDQLSLDFGPLTVITGPTASGKSNLADALLFAHDLARHPESALARRGGIGAVIRGKSPIVFDHRAAATREALEHSYQRHRIVIEHEADRWWIAEESCESWHRGERLAAARRERDHLVDAGAAVAARESMMQSAAIERQFGRHPSLRAAFRLELEARNMRGKSEPLDVRLRPDGTNLAAAIARLKESRSYAGMIETIRNIVPGLSDLDTLRDDDGRLELLAEQTLAPGVVTKLRARSLSDGTLCALGTLVAAQQLAPDELMVVEHSELHLDAASSALVLDALVAASRRATVVITAHDKELAEAMAADALVSCRFRAGRTEVATPGLRVL
jgi:predicted ATPase